jgi:prostaglandin reductase 1
MLNIAPRRLLGGCANNVLDKMVKAKRYVFQKQFVGLPKATDLKLVEEELPPLKDGGKPPKLHFNLVICSCCYLEFLSEAVYLSVDPYMRAYAPRLTLGTTFIGSQVAK